MYRASTPTHEFTLPFNYAEYVQKCLITYKQGCSTVLEKTEKDVQVNGNTVSVKLTQKETNLFCSGPVKIQMRILTKGGDSIPSQEITVGVKDVLSDEVL